MSDVDNEKLIEEARRWPAGVGPIPSAAPGKLIARLTDALEAAEKAHTPTDDEREALVALVNDARLRPGTGRTMPEVAADVILAAGFHRSEVPEPSAEGLHQVQYDDGSWSRTLEGPTEAETLNGMAHYLRLAAVEEPQGEPSGIPFYDEKMRELAEVRAQGEPSDAQVLDRIERFAQSDGVMFAGGPRGAWLPVDALLDILGERAR